MSKNVQAPSLELMALPQEVSQMICVQLFKHTALQMDLAPGVGCDIHYVYTHCSRSMLMTCKQIRQSWLHYFLLHTQLELLFTKPKDSDYCQYLGDIMRFVPDSVMATLQSVDINPLPAAALEDCTTHEGLHMRYVRYACLRRCRNIQQIRVRECLGITTLARWVSTFCKPPRHQITFRKSLQILGHRSHGQVVAYHTQRSILAAKSRKSPKRIGTILTLSTLW